MKGKYLYSLLAALGEILAAIGFCWFSTRVKTIEIALSGTKLTKLDLINISLPKSLNKQKPELRKLRFFLVRRDTCCQQ